MSKEAFVRPHGDHGAGRAVEEAGRLALGNPEMTVMWIVLDADRDVHPGRPVAARFVTLRELIA